MNSSPFKKVKAHSLIHSIVFCIILILSSCDKGDDFIDGSAAFPLGWKSTDTTSIIAFNVKDTLSSFIRQGYAPLGTVIDANFGTMRTSFYASYQTTTSSKTFTFASLDSVVLIMPYYYYIPTYGNADQSFQIEVYEMTESLDISDNTKKNSYLHASAPIGALSNFIPKVYDSVLDAGVKSAPAIRIALPLTFANKLISPGSYADDAAFQTVLKGLYVRSHGNTNTNGFVFVSTESDNKIKIYGKNSSGESITSTFTTGGSNSSSVNEYLHDNSSLAATAASTANKTSGDNILYNCGLYGYYNKLKLPDFVSLSKDKNIFRTELSIYSIDTGFYRTSSLGLLYIDSATGREVAMPDEYYRQNYFISAKDTSIGGVKCREFRYNISLFVNSLVSKLAKSNQINIYSAPLNVSRTGTLKFSSKLPSRIVLGGSNHVAKPKIKIFYTDKN